MIRDMELLLNTVYDDEIKSYLREALNCYSAEAYRACVIMSIIGGIHDLHNKLKILAPSNHDIADLEKKVSNSKEKLNPYERLLVDGCARSDIDLLTQSEAKEINRCFDIRFVTIITQNAPDFDNHFISLAKDYISNNFDDNYATILTNTINKLENSGSKS